MYRKLPSMPIFAMSVAAISMMSSSTLAQVTAVKADRILTGTRAGEVIEKGVILVEDGKILRVGKDLEIPADARVFEHAGVVAPGMIDLCVSFGADDLSEAIEGYSPNVHASDGLNPWDPAFEVWRRAGFTTVHILPPAKNTLSGTGAVWKTGGAMRARELLRRASLRASLTASSRDANRAPTSLMGAVLGLRQLFAREGENDVIDSARRRQMTVWIDTSSKAEVLAALGLIREHRLDARLLGTSYPGEVLELVEKANVPLVLSRLDYDDGERRLRSFGAIDGSQHRLGFHSGSDGKSRPELRRAAALALRQGMEREVALHALTGGAAEVLGVAARVGTLEAGKDADMVWYDGDPLDLGSRVVAVFIGGERVDTETE